MDYTNSSHIADIASFRAVIAIPARNEERRIQRCLLALAGQTGIDMSQVDVVVLVNNTTDGTIARAAELSASLPYELRLHSVTLPPGESHVGTARRLAMDVAHALLHDISTGVILTTDADSCVAPGWLQANLLAIQQGADAVAGAVEYGLDDDHPKLRYWKRLEYQYELLAAEIDARLDPVSHNPWPRHQTESGASLAIRASAYELIGGLPKVAVAEDRALCSVILSRGLALRHATDVRVRTSARLSGRAPGGAADCLRARLNDNQAVCDLRFASVPRTIKRALMRRQARLRYLEGRFTSHWLLRQFALTPEDATEIAASTSFHAAWEALLQKVPALRGSPLLLRQLPLQILSAQLLLFPSKTVAKAKRLLAADPAGIPASAFATVSLQNSPQHE